MQKLLGLGVVVVGIILLTYGLDASDSLGSGVSTFLSGAESNKTIWLIAGGAVCLVAGLGSTLSAWRGTRSS